MIKKFSEKNCIFGFFKFKANVRKQKSHRSFRFFGWNLTVQAVVLSEPLLTKIFHLAPRTRVNFYLGIERLLVQVPYALTFLLSQFWNTVAYLNLEKDFFDILLLSYWWFLGFINEQKVLYDIYSLKWILKYIKKRINVKIWFFFKSKNSNYYISDVLSSGSVNVSLLQQPMAPSGMNPMYSAPRPPPYQPQPMQSQPISL